uniref:Calponin-homology (CH) domain-containing protein n=1 Tax=Accipiter nisus TaxID=211598 RepID=A0A8B9MRI0_9AVES
GFRRGMRWLAREQGCDLAEDAPWKRIQQNTFTRWCNEHLKCVQKRVGNLQTDLGDGLRLIALLEVLSQKKMGRKVQLLGNWWAA